MAAVPDATTVHFFEHCFVIAREPDPRKWDAMLAALPEAAREPCRKWLYAHTKQGRAAARKHKLPERARKPERITHVAIQVIATGEVFKLRAPRRHHHVLQLMAAKRVPKHAEEEQGFWTNRRRFVGREEALLIAKAAGQLRRREGPGHYQGPELFSEDLW